MAGDYNASFDGRRCATDQSTIDLHNPLLPNSNYCQSSCYKYDVQPTRDLDTDQWVCIQWKQFYYYHFILNLGYSYWDPLGILKYGNEKSNHVIQIKVIQNIRISRNSCHVKNILYYNYYNIYVNATGVYAARSVKI